MKKIYFLLVIFIFSGLIGKSQCGLDSSNMQPGLYPPDSTLQPWIQGYAYDTFAQLYLPAFVNDSTDTLQILTTILDTITGLPRGVFANPSSGTISTGGRLCIEFTGTTVSPPGSYNLSFSGTVHVVSAALGDTLLSLTDFDSVVMGYGYAAPFQYALSVIPVYVAPCDSLDTTKLSQPGVYPVPSDLPCIVQGVPYGETVQGKIQLDSTILVDGFTVVLTVDSVQLDSILGLPTGITFGRSPQAVPGGGYGCVTFMGTTNDTVGTYYLTAYGDIWYTATIAAINQSVPYESHGANLNNHSPFGGYYLRVIATGDSCSLTIPTPPSGINDYFNNLNATLSVFPNPSNGFFTLKIEADKTVSGQIFVYDAVGRVVYQRPVEASGEYSTNIDLSGIAAGIYSLQVRTASGFVATKISVE